MEVLSSSAVLFSTVSFLSSTPSSLTNLSRKTHLKSRKTFPNPSFSTTNSPISKPPKPHIIARFGRPTKRRNSLRKKLNGNNNNDSQVSQNLPNLIDPLSNFVDNQGSQSNSNTNFMEANNDKVGNFDDGSKRLGESVLWNKLESWVELYKKDIEFWGVGSKPIFTVYQDINGSVERVLVDEDEILRRNGVDPLYYREDSELEVFDEMNSKISHANFLARELESGKDVIPRNSSVAKFVASGEKSGFITRIRSVSFPKNLVPKVYEVGIAVVCGFIFVWATKKLVALAGKRVEATGFEKEMLRRKMKARLEEEKSEKGSVEVVEEATVSPVLIAERPQFDKEVVLDSIRRAKGLSSDLAVLNGGGSDGTASVAMDFKIKEIQMMARRAREIENSEVSATDGNGPGKEIGDELMELSVEPMNSFGGDHLEKLATEEHVEAHQDNLLDESTTERRVANSHPEPEISDNQGGSGCGSNITDEETSERIENVKLHNVSNGRFSYGEKHYKDSHRSPDSSERGQADVSSTLSPPMKKPMRRMPKIIRSVKEAREYLSLKSDKKPLIDDISAAAAAEHGEPVSSFKQRLRQGDDLPVSSDHDRILDSAPAASGCEFNSFEESKCFETDINALDGDTQGEIRPLDQEIDKHSSEVTRQNLARTRQPDEMFKHINFSKVSESVSSENTDHDTRPDVDEFLSSSEWLDKVDAGTSKGTDLKGFPNLVPCRISSNDAGNSEGELVIHSASADLLEKMHCLKEKGLAEVDGHNETSEPSTVSEIPVPTEINDNQDFKKAYAETGFDAESNEEPGKGALFADKKSWLEKNFHEVEPIVNKIGSGFRDNYMVAREKVKQEVGSGLDFMELRSLRDTTELEWMQDDKLRDIVFKVRDNELAGRDPFHSMDRDDKAAFFKGLEVKVEKENQKLSALHEWLHSNIENVDYGADGISIYDPPEKVIPRWKGPPIEDIPEFLTNIGEQQQGSSSLRKENQSTELDYTQKTQEASPRKPKPAVKVSKSSKTLIEASDGSIKPGKKSGKEYWQHTKKWSRGFVDSYNAETDPDMKSTMKDIGKDLDRWITEKEIQEAAELMDKLPQKGKAFVEKKINKLKREMELFGPQAVVSKYREYADEKEEDYLWWLDLPHVLCLEMYTFEGEDQQIGFYTLEMALDLELEPKPQHMIAFQDPSDCKNFCYIIQAHLEMLGKGKAFIVPLPPKDVFREAKANGFGVTVIRKGEVQFNVDQPLEEVEELITEIGSKMYHDKIMKERSVDISSLMKGVFGFNKPIKRNRKKRSRKRRISPP